MDDQLCITDKFQKFRPDIGNTRFVLKKFRANAVNLLGALVDVSLRINVLVKTSAGKTTIHQFNCTNFNNPVPAFGF